VFCVFENIKYPGHAAQDTSRRNYEVHDTLKTQNENFATAIGALAAMATFIEIGATPKPGLVDSWSSGAHDDMDRALFMLSALALAPYWESQAADGIKCGESGDDEDLFPRLRARGLDMESAMLEATGGVNTHKGLIFALSLLVGATGACLSSWDLSPEKICEKSSQIISPFMAIEFENIEIRGADAKDSKKLSHGEKIFLEHGIGGVRREAMRGFPSLLAGLAEYEDALARGAKGNDAAVSTLLVLMLKCEDTNVIHRAGFDFWSGEYLERTAEAKKNFNPLRPDYKPLLDLDEFLVKNKASPGGAADLLACTLFLYRSKIPDNKQ
jgi:triphosphoribosyl-dephospho-CoA synthetase